ncbi:fatty acid desaturase [candidate division KSB1 bacterium]|nr:fatty acid desaturase [candidate division KSB1 bacterium]NIR68352.1 fatty acid desaturase [candidate division KSB1 bacterium]NIS28292.1 fatty acid desaturase [candidate division KSB1 bacterium]NIT75164.1 fatty acid desaturase [candidate division KSB1 bacterium]NIU28968.1 fatty acid desaturase [candidate division KSB1 bacterium]
MKVVQTKEQRDSKNARWQAIVSKYHLPHKGRSVWQIVNSIIPYFILWYLMYLSLDISYWMTLGLAVLAAGFMTRIFIICHDCGHGSFFKSRQANDIWGWITGILTFTPFYQWRHDHAVHHATSGDLDRRGVGEVWTLTVPEYKESSGLKKLGYRLYRNPFVMFGFGSLYYFLIRNRFPSRSASKRAFISVHWTNFTLLAAFVLLGATIGFTNVLLVQMPILMIGMAAGVWLFYIQHQFEEAYWERQEEWDYVAAALEGSSFYRLPKILQWFTGNIGFHHIHHLSPRIPNYLLEKCHNENPLFQKVEPITLATSLKSLTFRLWDDNEKKLVGFRSLK